MFKSIYLSFVVIVVLTFISQAQNYSVNNHKTIQANSIGAKVLGQDSEGLLYLDSEKRIPTGLSGWYSINWLKVVNPVSGKIVAEKRLKYKDLRSKGYKEQFVEVINNRPFLFLKNKENEFSIVGLDKDLNPVGEIMYIGKGYEKREQNSGKGHEFHVSTCLNGSDYFLTRKATNKNKSRLLIMGYDMHGKNHTKIDFEVPQESFGKNISFLSTARDKHYVYLGYKNKPIVIEKDGVSQEFSLDIEIKDCYPSGVRLAYRGDKIIIAGNILKEDGGEYVGVFSSKFDIASEEMSNVDIFMFDSRFIYDNSLIERSNNNSNNPEPAFFPNRFDFFKTLETEDGGVVYFYQRFYSFISVGGQMNNGEYFNYTTLIAFKVNSNGELDWVNFIPIDQQTHQYNPGVGFNAIEKNNEIFVFTTYRQTHVNEKDIRVIKGG